MKSNLLSQAIFAAATLTLLSACAGGGDTRNRNNTIAPFEGLWIDQGAYTDFTSAGDSFCGIVQRSPLRHGANDSRFGIPAVRILRISAVGNVFRWSPSAPASDLSPGQRGLFLGRINPDGSPAGDRLGEVRGIGTGGWRQTSADQIAQIFGIDPFSRRDLSDRRRSQSNEFSSFQYARIGVQQARDYLLRLRECGVPGFTDGVRRRRDQAPVIDPAAPIANVPAVPAPVRGQRNSAPAAPLRDPVSPQSTEESAPNEGFRPGPAAPTGGYIPDEN